MRLTKVTLTCAGMLIFMMAGMLMLPVRASQPQWFPADGTTIDYAMTSYTSFNNGTGLNSTRFYVYNASGQYIYEPAYFYQQWPQAPTGTWPGATLVASNASVVLRHVYTAINSTTLQRITKVITGTIIDATQQLVMILSRDGTKIADVNFKLPNRIVQKESFMAEATDFASSFDPIDYFDNTAVPITSISPRFWVVSVTSDRIIALRDDGSQMNASYVAEKNGKLLLYTISDPATQGYSNAKATSLAFETTPSLVVSPPAPTIFDTLADWIILGIVAIFVFFLGLWAGRSHRLGSQARHQRDAARQLDEEANHLHRAEHLRAEAQHDRLSADASYKRAHNTREAARHGWRKVHEKPVSGAEATVRPVINPAFAQAEADIQESIKKNQATLDQEKKIAESDEKEAQKLIKEAKDAEDDANTLEHPPK
jgi:hypothetical protein